MNNRLAARVEAKNLVNSKANELAPKIKEIFAPYVGKKIFKADRSFVAGIPESLKPFFQEEVTRIWCHRLEYTLLFKISASKPIEENSGCEYAEANIRIGTLDDQILKEIDELTWTLPTNYSVAGIEHARARARELEHQLSVVRLEYACFGENDFSKVQAE